MDEDPIVLFSTLAVKGPLQRDVLPHLPDDLRVRTVFDPTAVLLKRIEAGEHPAAMIALSTDLDALHRRKLTGPPEVLVRTGIGLGFDARAPRPDVSSVPRLTEALTTARSVAYSRSGASGKYFADLLDRLGIADQVNINATIVEKGFTGDAVLDGRADLAVQQISELRVVDGIELAGPLPAEVQHHSEFSITCWNHNDHRATALVRALRSDQAVRAYRDWGLQTPEEFSSPPR